MSPLVSDRRRPEAKDDDIVEVTSSGPDCRDCEYSPRQGDTTDDSAAWGGQPIRINGRGARKSTLSGNTTRRHLEGFDSWSPSSAQNECEWGDSGVPSRDHSSYIERISKNALVTVSGTLIITMLTDHGVLLWRFPCDHRRR